MLTNNYRIFFKNQFFPQLRSDVLKDIYGNSYTSIDVSGSLSYITYYPGYFTENLATTFNPDYVYVNSVYTYAGVGSIGIYTGSNATPPSPTDYAIKGIGGLQYNLTYTTSGALGKRCLDAIIELTNKNSTTVTINEVGLVQYMYYPIITSSSSSPSIEKKESAFLLDRSLLDVPLVLTPNESGVLKYYIDIDITPNVN